MTAGQGGDHGRVDDTKPLDSAQTEVRRDHRRVVLAHAARADRVVQRLRPRPQVRTEGVVVDRVGPGEQLAGHVPGQRRGRQDPAGATDALEEQGGVLARRGR